RNQEAFFLFKYFECLGTSFYLKIRACVDE
ncbi:MAG: hypothetical protein ACI86L_001308, partial [Dokdonia sp.]